MEIKRPAPFYIRPLLVFVGSPPSSCVVVMYPRAARSGD